MLATETIVPVYFAMEDDELLSIYTQTLTSSSSQGSLSAAEGGDLSPSRLRMLFVILSVLCKEMMWKHTMKKKIKKSLVLLVADCIRGTCILHNVKIYGTVGSNLMFSAIFL